MMPEHLRGALREVYRYLTKLRRRVEGTCPVCGKAFTGLVTRRYCSVQCRSKAYYWRNRAAVRQRRREAYWRRKVGQ
jgi:predicted nucleic acid-binding Zn ribbon protein